MEDVMEIATFLYFLWRYFFPGKPKQRYKFELLRDPAYPGRVTMLRSDGRFAHFIPSSPSGAYFNLRSLG